MSVSDLPPLALVVLFGAAAAVVWLAGIRLSDTTDVLSTRLGLGEALGGLLLLAFATNLPEIAIVASAAMNQHASKVDYSAGQHMPEAVDPAFHGVVQEVHQCAGCGNVELRASTSVLTTSTR